MVGSSNARRRPTRKPPPGPTFSVRRTIRTDASSSSSSSPPSPLTTTITFSGLNPSTPTRARTRSPARRGRRWVTTTAVTRPSPGPAAWRPLVTRESDLSLGTRQTLQATMVFAIPSVAALRVSRPFGGGLTSDVVRILAVANHLGSSGGLERTQMINCRGLRSRKHRLDLVYASDGELTDSWRAFASSMVQVPVTLPRRAKPVTSMWGVVSGIWKARRLAPDVVYVYRYWDLPFAVAVAAASRAAVVYHLCLPPPRLPTVDAPGTRPSRRDSCRVGRHRTEVGGDRPATGTNDDCADLHESSRPTPPAPPRQGARPASPWESRPKTSL